MKEKDMSLKDLDEAIEDAEERESKEVDLLMDVLDAEIEKTEKNEGEEKELNIAVLDAEIEKAEKEEAFIKNFVSTCSFPFDPNSKSDCFIECKQIDPGSYADCLAHYNRSVAFGGKPKIRKVGKKTGIKKSGTQLSRIINILENEDPMVEKAIAEMAETTLSRVRRSFKKLIYREKKMVKITPKGKVFLEKRFPDKKGIQAYKISNENSSVYVQKYCS